MDKFKLFLKKGTFFYGFLWKIVGFLTALRYSMSIWGF
jgi:hypothetical protein